MDDVMARMRAVFEDVFDQRGLAVDADTTARDIPGWDSLATINLVVALESEFRIKFALGEIQELNNVGDMEALIRKKMAGSVRR
jgi:acyl carrier protein